MEKKSVFRRLYKYLLPHKKKIILALVCMLCFSILNALQPFIVLTGTNVVQKSDSQLDLIKKLASNFIDVEAMKFYYLAGVVIILFSLKGLFSYLQLYLMDSVGKYVIRDMRDKLYSHFQTLSIEFFSGAKTGELISRVTNDIIIVEEAVSRVFANIILQPLCIVFMLTAAFYISWQLAIVAFILFPIIIFPIIGIGKRVRKNTTKIQSQLANLTSILQETFSGIRVVKAFNMEEYEIDKFKKENKNLLRSSLRIVKKLNVIRPTMELMGGISIAAAIIIGVGLLKMNLQEILAFSTSLVLLYDPAKKLGNINNRIQIGLAAADRVFEMLDKKPTVIEHPGAVDIRPIDEKLVYEDVNFRYDEQFVLKNINLQLKKGEIVALVGPSGAGKSTIVNLLLRFYDTTSGSIKIDATDIRRATIKSLRSQMGIVTQDVILFNDTVSANIAYGKPETPKQQIIDAARAANAHDFIMSLPEKYDTIIGERGIKLSGGQQQRIAIARAILKNPPILILDEATSALDTESERLVQQAIDHLMQHRTVLVIAHRLSTVQHADKIIVLDNGEIIQQGSHAELIEAGGLYKKLYEMQFNF